MSASPRAQQHSARAPAWSLKTLAIEESNEVVVVGNPTKRLRCCINGTPSTNSIGCSIVRIGALTRLRCGGACGIPRRRGATTAASTSGCDSRPWSNGRQVRWLYAARRPPCGRPPGLCLSPRALESLEPEPCAQSRSAARCNRLAGPSEIGLGPAPVAPSERPEQPRPSPVPMVALWTSPGRPWGRTCAAKQDLVAGTVAEGRVGSKIPAVLV